MMENKKTSGLRRSEIIKLTQSGNNLFSAFRAAAVNYSGLADPLLGFDDFQLKSDVFGPHQHRHISAISYIFDDSAPYRNIDSMGTDLTISPGSLLWTWAGSGVTHHEFPEKNGTDIHGLQLFLQIPARKQNNPAESVYIDVTDMPVINDRGVEVKVVIGSADGQPTNSVTPDEINFLDVRLSPGAGYESVLPAGWNGFIYVLSGQVEISDGYESFSLLGKDTIAVGGASRDNALSFLGHTSCRLLFINGRPAV